MEISEGSSSIYFFSFAIFFNLPPFFLTLTGASGSYSLETIAWSRFFLSRNSGSYFISPWSNSLRISASSAELENLLTFYFGYFWAFGTFAFFFRCRCFLFGSISFGSLIFFAISCSCYCFISLAIWSAEIIIWFARAWICLCLFSISICFWCFFSYWDCISRESCSSRFSLEFL